MSFAMFQNEKFTQQLSQPKHPTRIDFEDYCVDDDDDDEDKFDPIPKIVNGGLAGIISLNAVYPLDTVTTRLQNQQPGPNKRVKYANMRDCFWKIYRTEGPVALYRGCLMNSLMITPETAIKLTTNDFFRYLFTTDDGCLPLWKQMIAGGLAGAMQLIVTTPMELVKIQMQDHGRVQPLEYNQPCQPLTARDLVRNIVRKRGVLGLYRGFQPTAVREICFSIMYYPLFSILVESGPRRSNGCLEAAPWMHFLAGMLSASWAAFAVTPLDVIKTRLQTHRKAKGDRQFRGMLDCFHTTLKYEGPQAFFKGGLCRVLMISPLFAITQLVYFMAIGEKFLSRIKRRREL